MLEWSAEQVVEINMEGVVLEFTPAVANTEQGVPNVDLC